jgi:hypothetical protein
MFLQRGDEAERGGVLPSFWRVAAMKTLGVESFIRQIVELLNRRPTSRFNDLTI